MATWRRVHDKNGFFSKHLSYVCPGGVGFINSYDVFLCQDFLLTIVRENFQKIHGNVRKQSKCIFHVISGKNDNQNATNEHTAQCTQLQGPLAPLTLDPELEVFVSFSLQCFTSISFLWSSFQFSIVTFHI